MAIFRAPTMVEVACIMARMNRVQIIEVHDYALDDGSKFVSSVPEAVWSKAEASRANGQKGKATCG